MTKRTRIRHDDAQNAPPIVEETIKEELVLPSTEKDPIAVELGRRGGLKGGRARSRNLSASQLSRIGKMGAEARWKKR